MVQNKNLHCKTAIEKELRVVRRKEEVLHRAATKSSVPKWKIALTEKVPDKVSENLQKVFCKAFSFIFEQGTDIIEKTYDRNSIQKDCKVRNFAIQLKADRKSLKKVWEDAKISNLRNTVITGVEGITLGALGIGLPDIVIFVGLLLKGIYEISLQYGFDYKSEKERYFILKLMETSILRGEAWEAGNREIDRIIVGGTEAKDWTEAVKHQIDSTAEAFAVDMVFLKFIQGLPVVGIVGGAANPVYYNKVMKYVEVKCRKRYLISLEKAGYRTVSA